MVATPPSSGPESTAFKETEEVRDRSYYRDRKASDDISKVKGSAWRELQRSNVVSKYKDPCAEAGRQSQICMDLNNYNKEACAAYFQAYRDCKEEWDKAGADARKKMMADKAQR